VAILPTMLYWITLNNIAMDPSALRMGGTPDMLQQFTGPSYTSRLDNGPIVGAYIGLFALGSIFCAFGILSSALTDNQVVAYILGAFLCFGIYFGFSFLAQLESLTAINTSVARLGILAHFESIGMGVVDTRDILYFGSLLAFTLMLTRLVLNLKRN